MELHATLYKCMPNWCRNGVEGRGRGIGNWCRREKSLRLKSLKKEYIIFNTAKATYDCIVWYKNDDIAGC